MQWTIQPGPAGFITTSDASKRLLVSDEHDNTQQELIHITEDKACRIVDRHIRTLESNSQWSTPFSIFLALIAVFYTAEFKAAFGLSKDTWQAVHLICTVGSLYWLIRCFLRLTRRPTVEDIVSELKGKGLPERHRVFRWSPFKLGPLLIDLSGGRSKDSSQARSAEQKNS